MKNCITCLFQGDNNVDANGEGKIFCMMECKWKREQDSCPHFVEYADLSKEIRLAYAMRKNGNGSDNGIKSLIKSNWITMVATFVISFVSFLILVKFFDKYIF